MVTSTTYSQKQSFVIKTKSQEKTTKITKFRPCKSINPCFFSKSASPTTKKYAMMAYGGSRKNKLHTHRTQIKMYTKPQLL